MEHEAIDFRTETQVAAALHSRTPVGPLPAPRRYSSPAAQSLNLLEGARQRLELARISIAQGSDPQPVLREAMRRIRKLPMTLAPGDSAIVANLADLSDYMCRRLRAVRDEAGIVTLNSMCDLLREIRCGWVTALTAAPTLRGGSSRTARM